MINGYLRADGRKGIRNMVLAVAQGTERNSEALGHQEFCMKYKRFEAIGPECSPI